MGGDIIDVIPIFTQLTKSVHCCFHSKTSIEEQFPFPFQCENTSNGILAHFKVEIVKTVINVPKIVKAVNDFFYKVQTPLVILVLFPSFNSTHSALYAHNCFPQPNFAPVGEALSLGLVFSISFASRLLYPKIGLIYNTEGGNSKITACPRVHPSHKTVFSDLLLLVGFCSIFRSNFSIAWGF